MFGDDEKSSYMFCDGESDGGGSDPGDSSEDDSGPDHDDYGDEADADD